MTRADLEAIHAEFLSGAQSLFSDEQLAAIKEHLVYLKGAIVDYTHPPAARRKMRQRWAKRRQKPARREAREQPAQLPVRAVVAA